MIFRTIRRTWHQERFKNHWSKIETLIGFRKEDERLGHKGKVLADNYELVSHATRALEALRKAEELGADRTEDFSQVKEHLQHLISLPSVADRDLQSTPQEKIDRLYDEYLTYRQAGPFRDAGASGASPKREEPEEPQDTSPTDPRDALPVDETAFLERLDAKAQRRLDELDRVTALVLVSKLRAKKLDQGVEAEGLSLADRPMPVEAQVRLMRMIYALVGQPFEGESWYNVLIATWLSFNAQHDRDALEFDYQHWVSV